MSLTRTIGVISRAKIIYERLINFCDDAGTVACGAGEFGVVTAYGNTWQGYAVGSQDEAYAELERLERGNGRAGGGPDR